MRMNNSTDAGPAGYGGYIKSTLKEGERLEYVHASAGPGRGIFGLLEFLAALGLFVLVGNVFMFLFVVCPIKILTWLF